MDIKDKVLLRKIMGSERSLYGIAEDKELEYD